MDPNYNARLQESAKGLADSVQIPITDLYFDDNMNKEMERLFGFPVYEEHKKIVNKYRKYGNGNLIPLQATASNSTSNVMPNLNPYTKKSSSVSDYAAAASTSTAHIQTNEPQDFNKQGQSGFSNQPLSSYLCSNNGGDILQNCKPGMNTPVSPAYKFYVAQLIEQDYKKKHSTKHAKKSHSTTLRKQRVFTPTYSKVLQEHKSPPDKPIDSSSSSQASEKWLATYKSSKESSKLLQLSMEQNSFSAVTDSMSRLTLNAPANRDPPPTHVSKNVMGKKTTYYNSNKTGSKLYTDQFFKNETDHFPLLNLRKPDYSVYNTSDAVAHSSKYYSESAFNLDDHSTNN